MPHIRRTARRPRPSTILAVEIWLIRHARPIRIDGGDGPADPGLTEQGHEQAARLTEWWAPFGADAVVSSTMCRAIETAAPLADALGVTPTTSDLIREFDAHLPTYVPVEELRDDPQAWEAMLAAWLTPEAEEERQRFRTGVVEAIDDLAASAPGERLAIVSHGGVINAYLSAMLHLPGTMFFEPAYTSVSRILWRPGGHRQLVSINEAPHLGTPPLPSISL